MPTITAQKLVDELQGHIARHPEAADWPIFMFNADPHLEPCVVPIERVVLDTSNSARRFMVE